MEKTLHKQSMHKCTENGVFYSSKDHKTHSCHESVVSSSGPGLSADFAPGDGSALLTALLAGNTGALLPGHCLTLLPAHLIM